MVYNFHELGMVYNDRNSPLGRTFMTYIENISFSKHSVKLREQ